MIKGENEEECDNMEGEKGRTRQAKEKRGIWYRMKGKVREEKKMKGIVREGNMLRR